MNLRKIERITIIKATVHILDKRLEEPMVAQAEMPLTEDITGYLLGHILKASRSSTAEAAAFKGDGMIKQLTEAVFLSQDTFVEASQTMAKRMFQVMRPMVAVESCDLVTVLFRSGDIPCMALLKLDHQQTMQHSIEYIDESFAVKLSAVENALPQTNNQLTACALINAPDLVTETGLLIIEREAQKEGPRWFLHRFLGADRQPDRMELTRIFKEVPEKFARRHLKNNYCEAEVLRAGMREELNGSATIDLKGFAEDTLSGTDAQEKLLLAFTSAGLPMETKLEIDRSWVTDKMKNRAIKTDTGFTIRADQEFFDDPARFELRRNGDGSVDYIIKNIRNVSEK